MFKKVYDLVIDKELEQITPPLRKCELDILESDLLQHGCKTPLIVWGGVIVDGHTRYRICQKYKIPFAIEPMNFEDKTVAKLWIIKNQLGRRNLSPFQRCEMVLPLEAEIKSEAERRRVRLIAQSREDGRKARHFPKTRDVLADMAGVSHSTIDKAKVIVKIGDEETKRRLCAGEISIHFAYTTLTGNTTKRSRSQQIEKSLDDVSNMINALLEELNGGDMDKETVISVLMDVSERLEKR